MLSAAMANPPEHDFAPSWLKIPQGGQFNKTSLDHRSSHKVNYQHEQYHPHDRPRRVDSFPGYLRPPHSQSSFPRGGHGQRNRDERRQYPHPSRQHSADDISSMPDPHHLPAFHPFGQYGGFPESQYFPSSSQFRGGRYNGGPRDGAHHHDGYPSSRGHLRTGRHHSGGRQRYPSGGSTGTKDRNGRSEHQNDGFNSKSSHLDERSKTSDRNGGRGPSGDSEGGDERSSGRGEKGVPESSALSTHDFPSLSGGKDKPREVNKPPQPAGVWEKPPGTTKVNIGGRNFTLTSKTSLKEDTPKAKTVPSTSSSSSSSPRSLVSASTTSTGTTLSLKLSSQSSTGQVMSPTSHGIIPIMSNNGGGSTIKVLVPTKVSSSKAATNAKNTSRKTPQKEIGMRSSPVSTTKDKPVQPLSNNSNAPTKELTTSKPSPTTPVDIPTPRLIVAKGKRGDKNDFLKELRRSSNVDGQQTILVNGSSMHEDHNYNRASILINGTEQMDNKLIVNNTKSNVNAPIQNGYLTTNDGWENNFTETSPNKLSSSLEAERRLLHEMGWHEHSDNEEGYAPITEDELKEFKLKSEQLKKNGVTRPNLINLQLSSISNSITSTLSQIIIDDLSSSESESSDDDD